MASWQKNVIVAVHFRDEKKHILQIKKMTYDGNQLGNLEIMSRQQVISEIETGQKFVTAYRQDANTWRLGEDVHVVTYNEQKFIRTDNNSKGEDNLQNLEEF